MNISAVNECLHLDEVILPIHDLHGVVLDHDVSLYPVIERHSLIVKSGCDNPFGLVTVPCD